MRKFLLLSMLAVMPFSLSACYVPNTIGYGAGEIYQLNIVDYVDPYNGNSLGIFDGKYGRQIFMDGNDTLRVTNTSRFETTVHYDATNMGTFSVRHHTGDVTLAIGESVSYPCAYDSTWKLTAPYSLFYASCGNGGGATVKDLSSDQ